MSQRKPAEVFPPGDYIREEIEARGWTQNDLAEILGRPVRLVNEIIAAKRAITPETARGLSEAFGTSAQVWLNLESSYQLSKIKDDDGDVARRAKLFSLAPVKDMVRRGWIKEGGGPAVLQEQILSFFDVTTLGDVENYRLRAAARQSTDYASETSEQKVWKRQAARMAKTFEVRPYQHDSFEKLRVALKRLTFDAQDVRHVPDVFAEHGVRFLVVEHLPGTKLDGVAFWDERGPIVVLTLRLDRVDYFWFTLAHELGHIFNGDGRDGHDAVVDDNIVDDGGAGADDVSIIEAKANDFARELLVPKGGLDAFVRQISPYFSRVEVIRFAESIGVHPGIVAGQLQKRGAIPYSQFRDMLVKVRDLVVPYAVTDGWGHSPTT